MGTSSDQMKTEIDQTRDKLSTDVDHLADRTSPRRIARRRSSRVRAAARNARQRMMGSPAEAGEPGGARSLSQSTQEKAGQATGAVRSAPGQAMRQTEGNPLAAGLVAFGAGMLAAAVIPASRDEQRAAGQLKDKGRDMAEPVASAASESGRRVAEEAKATAQTAGQRVADTAKQGAQRTAQEAKDQSQSAARQVKEQRQATPPS